MILLGITSGIYSEISLEIFSIDCNRDSFKNHSRDLSGSSSRGFDINDCPDISLVSKLAVHLNREIIVLMSGQEVVLGVTERKKKLLSIKLVAEIQGTSIWYHTARQIQT